MPPASSSRRNYERRRRIRIAATLTAALLVVGGISYAAVHRPTPSVAGSATPGYTPPPAPKVLPLVAFLGDSYTAGDGASSPAKRWTTLLSQRKGWSEDNFGQSGTGYSTGGAYAASRGFQPYTDRVAAVIAAKPAVVVVSGGLNDKAQPLGVVRAAVTRTLAGLRSGLPSARLVVVGPFWPSAAPSAAILRVRDVVKQEARAVNATYIEALSPSWFPASPAQFLASDHVHPNDKGYARIAAKMARYV